MEKVVRTGIALPPGLLKRFDAAIKARRYKNRSEAVRDLVRNFLMEQKWSRSPDKKGVASLTIIYDHHSGGFMKKMASVQHSHSKLIKSTLHTHLDAHNCLEVIVMEGRTSEIRKLSDSIISLKGVKHGKLVATGRGA